MMIISGFDGNIFTETIQSDGDSLHRGGISLVSSLLTKHENELGRPITLIGNGDMLYGSPEAFYSNGEAMIQLLKRLPTGALVLGPRDFYLTSQEIARLINLAKAPAETASQQDNIHSFPILAANLQPAIFDSYVLLPDKQHPSYAIIGIIPPDAFEFLHPDQTKGYRLLNPMQTIRETRDMIREDYPNLDIYVMGHFVQRYDSHVALMKEMEGLEGITGVYGVTDQTDAVLEGNILYTPDSSRHYSLVESLHPLRSQEIIEQPNEVVFDEQLSRILARFRMNTEKRGKRQIGTCIFDIPYQTAEDNSWAHFITDILYKHVNQSMPIDAVLIHGDLLRAGGKMGPLTKLDLHQMLPFDDQLTVIHLSGQELLDALNYSVSEAGPGGFLHPSSRISFNYYYDETQGAYLNPNYVYVHNHRIYLTEEYQIAVPYSLVNGAYGYTMFMQGSAEIMMVIDPTIRTIVEEQISELFYISIPTEYRVVKIGNS